MLSTHLCVMCHDIDIKTDEERMEGSLALFDPQLDGVWTLCIHRPAVADNRGAPHDGADVAALVTVHVVDDAVLVQHVGKHHAAGGEREPGAGRLRRVGHADGRGSQQALSSRHGKHNALLRSCGQQAV